jgi:alpha-tubulin suppressor-like RCC1 family protein
MPNLKRGMMAAAGGGDSGTGELWSWGRNNNGQLGIGSTISKSSPVQIGDLDTWSNVTGAGHFSAAIKTDGTIWSWGMNDDGQLGHGDVIDRSSPTQIGSLTTWSKICAGEPTGNEGVLIAIKTDGTLWTWGSGFNGCRASGDAVDSSSPTQVGSLTTWETVTTEKDAIIATKTDGTLWAWGRQQSSQLGGFPKLLEDSLASYSSPVQVGFFGTSTDWARGDGKITCGTSSGGAIKTDGTLWVWGNNTKGQLGLGSVDAWPPSDGKNSPVQVGSLTDWKSIQSFMEDSATRGGFIAVKTGGTLWSWGYGTHGQTGQGNVVQYSSPTQIGSSTDWDSISSNGDGAVMATKTNGALFMWGRCEDGALGLGDVIYRSSPVQLGTNIWAAHDGSDKASMAIRK